MHTGKRIVVCIPYGRKRTVSILMNYLRRDRSVIDEVQFWMNTDPSQTADVEWAHEQERIYEGWVRCVERPTPTALTPKQLNTGKFYALTTEPDTLYFRFDDDIVYVHPAYFENMVAFRLANPQYLLVFGNIWNNAVISYIHQQAGRHDNSHGIVGSPYCMDPVGWASADYAIYIHRLLLDAIEGTAQVTPDYYLFSDRYELSETRFSISNFVWRGEDAAAWGGATSMDDEEIFLTEALPKAWHRANAINGQALVSHYSFFTQRALDSTDILERYRVASERALSEAYYKLLGEESVR